MRSLTTLVQFLRLATVLLGALLFGVPVLLFHDPSTINSLVRPTSATKAIPHSDIDLAKFLTQLLTVKLDNDPVRWLPLTDTHRLPDDTLQRWRG